MTETPGYVDLSLYDVSVSELISRAITDATTKLPGWTPREGNTEVVITESLALIVSELVYAINRLPSLTLEGLLGLYGISRDPGQHATGVVTIWLSDTFGHTIPAGTILRATSTPTGEEVDFTTDEDVVIAEGEYPAAATVAITAVEPGVDGNGFPASTILELVDLVAYVDQVSIFDTATAGGTEPETDDEFYDRGAALLSRLTSTLVLAEHFTAAALEDPNVGRAQTTDLYDGVGGSVGTDVGHVTVVVTDESGAALSAGIKSDLQDALTAKAVAGLTIHVIDPTVTTVNVEVNIKVKVGFDPDVVAASVEAALEGYLSPATWDWGGTVYFYELISLVDAVPGVDRPTSFVTPTTDTALSGTVGQLAQAGTITVNVV